MASGRRALRRRHTPRVSDRAHATAQALAHGVRQLRCFSDAAGHHIVHLHHEPALPAGGRQHPRLPLGRVQHQQHRRRHLLALLADYLRAAGYRISTASRGTEMRAVLAREAMDLVVLDLMLPGEDGLSACRRLRAAGVILSIGHSDADYDTVTAAIDAGMTGVTHLFNAMPSLSGRSPGIIGTALTEERLTAGLIVDGIHVDPISIRLAFAAKRDGIALVTDAMPSVGSSLHKFDLLGRPITLLHGRLTTAGGTLAGAHLDMASAVRNTVKLAGLPLEDALRAASLAPARFLGMEHERGALTAGARADLVALSEGLTVIATWIDGAREDVQ